MSDVSSAPSLFLYDTICKYLVHLGLFFSFLWDGIIFIFLAYISLGLLASFHSY